MLVSDLLYQAARAAHKLRKPGQGLSTDDLADGLTILNLTVDQWASRKAFAYSETFQPFTLTAGHSPHLIGPGLSAPDFAVTLRPQRIEQEGAAIILTDQTPNVDLPLTVRDRDWWNNQRVKALTSNVPTDLYYEPDFPSGSLYFWPVPNYAYGVRLRLWTVINQFAASSDTFTAPPGYQTALALTVAEQMCDWWEIPIPAGLNRRAEKARATVISANHEPKRIRTAPYGPASSNRRRGFNYYTGI